MPRYPEIVEIDALATGIRFTSMCEQFTATEIVEFARRVENMNVDDVHMPGTRFTASGLGGRDDVAGVVIALDGTETETAANIHIVEFDERPGEYARIPYEWMQVATSAAPLPDTSTIYGLDRDVRAALAAAPTAAVTSWPPSGLVEACLRQAAHDSGATDPSAIELFVAQHSDAARRIEVRLQRPAYAISGTDVESPTSAWIMLAQLIINHAKASYARDNSLSFDVFVANNARRILSSTTPGQAAS